MVEADLGEALPRHGNNIVTVRAGGSAVPVTVADVDLIIKYAFCGGR